MTTDLWTPFQTRLPTKTDADHAGQVRLLEQNGRERFGLWDWIPPGTPDAAKRWRANGFTAWRKT